MADDDCANPLFLSWVKELWDQAKLRNTKAEVVYGRAYRSLRDHPRRLEHPCEALALQGIGPLICEHLTKKLEEHCRQHGRNKRTASTMTSASDEPADGSAAPSMTRTGAAEMEPAPKRNRPPRLYVPKRRGGAYGILHALGSLRKGDLDGMTKSELIAAAQPYSDASYTVPAPGSAHHTAWNSMKTLILKGLVMEAGPRFGRQYYLSEEGWKVYEAMKPAEARLEAEGARSSDSEREVGRGVSEPGDDAVRHDPEGPLAGTLSSTPCAAITPILIPSDSFTVELIIDHREVRARNDRNYFQTAFDELGLRTSSRALDLGDFVWVAKLKDPALLQQYGDGADEIMLSHIVERKRKSDLIESIKSGRFVEQKFRLARSGIQNIIYVVEESSLSDMNQTNWTEHMMSAKAHTMVADRFFVKETASIQATITYLYRLTHKLREMFTGPNATRKLYFIPTRQIRGGLQGYQELMARLQQAHDGRTIHAVAFPTFSFLCSKSKMLTLRDVYLKMLMSIRGVSAEKALAIQRLWPVPNRLAMAFKSQLARGGREAAEGMIAEKLGSEIGPAKIQKALSKKIAEVWI
ncbi:Crossover junction endonuclease mus81 [Ascosphaera acerosa]|nr:Crossover junction endonuclease mus81 [Ascosphaera acerosa]